MITWIVALLIIGGFAGSGRQLGALRSAILLLGVIAAGIMAAKLGPVLRPYMVEMAKGNPLIIWLAPNLSVFVLVYLGSVMVAAAVHFKVSIHYKYKVPEEWRMAWERMNASVGVAMALVTGVAHFVVYGAFVYSLGYWSVQLDSPGKNPRLVNWLSGARNSLHSSGFEKLAAAFDPAPESFYHAADVMGLLYNNPSVGRRLVAYPGTLSLMERPEFQAIITNTPPAAASPGTGAPPAGGAAPSPVVGTNFLSQPPLDWLLANPKMQAIFNNKEIVTQIGNTDMKDLAEYLKTGKSPKYNEDKMLGCWDLYVPGTLIEMKRRHPQTPLGELARLKKVMYAFLSDITVIVTPDQKIFIKGSLPDAAQLSGILSAQLPTAPIKPTAIKVLAQGTWKKDGKNCIATFHTEQGDHADPLTVLADDNMVTSFKGEGMVLKRSE